VSAWRQRSALAGTVGGALAAGLAAGALAERRSVRAVRQRPDAEAREPFGQLPADRTGVVVASDGVELRYEEVGPLDAPLTLVFVHGYTLQMASWHYQREALADLGRLVLYDQRAHGRSGASPAEGCTIDQLGNDLETVLAARVPAGPVVLVGHSLGGMTIMALAERRPELFAAGGQVAGVALLCTSAGKLAQLTLGLPAGAARLGQWLFPRLLVGIGGRRARFVDAQRRRGLGNDFGYALTRRLSFGERDVSPALVDFVERMIAATPTEVIANFAPTFLSHDKLSALAALVQIPVLIVAGDADVLTPVGHAQAMAEVIGSAELVVLPGAGHLAQLERPGIVNLHLRALVRRALLARTRAA
jgi:pimeloyl-ACP methyl ester carboxylesterase